jgi:hypothetical protein
MIKECLQSQAYGNGKPFHIVEWKELSTNDLGSNLQSLQYNQISVQVSGVFGESCSIVIEGSNDGINFSTLNDSFGNAVHFTKVGLKSIGDVVSYLRPKVIGGDSTTSITVTLAAKV